ncbi:hypothetical protein JAAARDRAFT_124163 [Jaapia argillacea MUCL 33604]|uniref:GYF domain-containing protein n=1 Tax=Jaapia argillacea MUCL 33604 TaxID=933084 RepID=A0A067Q1P8_9AGAM|nr:hypothetical protein JAAARDRAFT_124163 [Jaapia argillacea MUCL 33604]
MPPRPAKRRAAGSVSETPSAQQKKTRFLDPTEDPTNFAEEVDAQLENPSATRKGRVKTEGYDSDTSGDEDDDGPRRKEGKDGEEEEEDMFAMADKEDKEDEDGGKKKEEKFLRLGDIEGQEFTEQKSGDEDSDDDDPIDEDDAERKKKKGMGFELSSFNMREEMEEGKFAEDGTYIRTFDPHAIHDRWMEGVDEREIKKTRKRQRERERKERERQEAEERELEEIGGKEQVEKQLLAMLKKGETVLEALQRLGAAAKKTGGGKKTKPNNRHKPETTDTAMEVDKPQKEPTDIETVTHLASTLMSLGDTDIYGKTWEELVRSVRSGGRVGPSWDPPSADPIKYEYRWDVPEVVGQDGQVFGPYSKEELDVWFKATYFGTSGEKVKVRKVGGDWARWSDIFS